MSFRSSSNKPSSRRSQSFRTSSSANNTVPGLASYNRPRSLNFFSTSSPSISPSYTSGYSSSPTSSNFHSVLGTKNYNYNAFNPYSKYSSHPLNNYSNYGGTSSGYGAISFPSKTLSALNIMPTSYTPKNYDSSSVNHRDYLKLANSTPSSSTSTATNSNNDKSRQSRSRSRNNGGSFNRSRSHSAIRDSSMGSRSVSLSSLNSEGYVSGSEKSSRSRLGSASDLAALRGENGELDYKKMYEQAISENDRLRDKLRKNEEELRDTKQTLEKINTVTSKNSLSELEKRERRAMERKLSEMEEELKQLEALKTENQRLKDENGALIRVISKLSK